MVQARSSSETRRNTGWNICLSLKYSRDSPAVQEQNRDSVTLTCGTENCTPKQKLFAWFKNQRLIPEATDIEFRISSVSHHDFGNYSCTLKNSSSTSADEILLDVKCMFTSLKQHKSF
uniref:Ig-like domain-containing protein n=1 Tax=Cyprinus carpio TaxID=7962 RepID=A0A8C1NW19_CYPCA